MEESDVKVSGVMEAMHNFKSSRLMVKGYNKNHG